MECPNCQSLQFKPFPEADVIEQEIRGTIALQQSETTVNNTVEFRMIPSISKGIQIGVYINIFGKIKVEFPMNVGKFSEGNKLFGTRYFKVNNWFLENTIKVGLGEMDSTNKFLQLAKSTNSDPKSCWKLTSALTKSFGGKIGLKIYENLSEIFSFLFKTGSLIKDETYNYFKQILIFSVVLAPKSALHLLSIVNDSEHRVVNLLKYTSSFHSRSEFMVMSNKAISTNNNSNQQIEANKFENSSNGCVIVNCLPSLRSSEITNLSEILSENNGNKQQKTTIYGICEGETFSRKGLILKGETTKNIAFEKWSELFSRFSIVIQEPECQIHEEMELLLERSINHEIVGEQEMAEWMELKEYFEICRNNLTRNQPKMSNEVQHVLQSYWLCNRKIRTNSVRSSDVSQEHMTTLINLATA